MRYLSTIIIAVTAMLFMAFRVDGPLPIGSALPKAELKLKDVSGKEVSLQQAKKNKGLLVMFSCNTCPYVVKNQQRTKEICAYASQLGLGVIVLNSNAANRENEDSFDAMKNYAKDQQYQWMYAVDDKNVLADAFGATRTPECYLFNSELKLVYHGAIDNNPGDEAAVSRKHLKLAIDELSANKEISVKETKSVGCGIKRVNS